MKVKNILNAVCPKWYPNNKYNKMIPKISIILPTFKRAKSGNFEKAIESILKQTYTNWELIIVDDASTDGTEDLIKFYMQIDERINYIRHTYNMGLPSISEYEGYTKARGEYIAFIFDDNIWDENHLMLSMKAMIKHNVKFTYGITRIYDKGNSYVDIDLGLNLLPYTNCIGNGSVVIHKDIIETIGLYDPHLSLTRVCDWDYWQRVFLKFEIYKIPKIVTYEYGVRLNDSLGNTVKMNTWTILEHMSTDRNDKLLPKNYEEYDIIGYEKQNTQSYLNFVSLFYSNYRNKKWYVPNQPFIKSSPVSKKRILLLVHALDASYFLAFHSLKEKYIIRLSTFPNFSENDILSADVIIAVRNSHNAIIINERIKNYNIPFYFYTDDNFIEVLKNIDEDSLDYSIISTCNDALKDDRFKNIKKVITSTDKLKDYLITKKIHNKIEVLPPSFNINLSSNYSQSENSINIAFIGGEFRENTFIEYIYPAIIKLSKIKPVKLICTQILHAKINKTFKSTDKIQFQIFDRDPCYYQIINKIKVHNVHILIHSGKDIENNKYKTNNALINAVMLGAVLITSNIKPYKDCKQIICAENTVEDWYQKLKSIALKPKIRKNKYDIQKNYAIENYSVENVSETFEKILKDVECTQIADIINRYEIALYSATKYEVRTEREIIHNYMFIDSFLNFNEIKYKPISYILKPDCLEFSRLGIIFSSEYPNSKGKVIAEIKDTRNNLICESSIDIKDIAIRQINYFYFDNIITSPKKIKLVLTAKYEGNHKNTIGVYENKNKKSLVYKVLKKLFNIRLRIRNLLYYENI